MTDARRAAVVVATRNRRDRVLRLLDALERQEGVALEVVVVDDASDDDTADAVGRFAASSTLTVRLVRAPAPGGPAAARNLGWQASDAAVVIFTDDDCVPASKWAAALLDVLDGEHLDVVAGVTAVPEDQLDRITMFAHRMADDGNDGRYSTSNIAYHREVLDALGGFDAEAFRYQSPRTRGSTVRGINGEDTDLAWRAIEAGFRAGVAPDSIVYHDVSPQPWLQYARNMRRLEGIVLLFKKHPQLRRRFGRHLFFREQDVSVLGFAAGLVGLRIRRLRPLLLVSVLSAAWYVVVHRRHLPPPERGGYCAGIPLAFVADAYAVAVMIRASARYRTLLL